MPDPLTRDLCASISFLYFQAFFFVCKPNTTLIWKNLIIHSPSHHILITCPRQRRFSQGLPSLPGKISRVMITTPIPHPVLAGRVWRLRTAAQRNWKEWGTSTHHTLGTGAAACVRSPAFPSQQESIQIDLKGRTHCPLGQCG